MDRRTFIAASVAAAGGSQLATGAEVSEEKTLARPLIISTWPFGLPGNEAALKAVQEDGGSTLDAVEAGIRFVEASGNSSVGLSGRPNAAGYSQLDACIMHGPGQQAGSVAAVEGIIHPITAARRVMEKTKHVMLAGEGARWFAIREGLESVDTSTDEEKKDSWLESSETQSDTDTPPGEDNHDTITMLVLGADGTISGGCSTSGLAGKLPGRVGDSPILGGGLYLENEVGAAGATGVGENVMRYCATYQIVEFMRNGVHPQEACRKVIERIAKIDPLGKKLDINFIALDKQGRYGAAGTNRFAYSLTYPGYSQVNKIVPLA